MKKTNYKALKVANVVINIAIVLIVLSTVVVISLSWTQPHLNLMNQAGDGFSFDVIFQKNFCIHHHFLVCLL